jgi:hypothetical protein
MITRVNPADDAPPDITSPWTCPDDGAASTSSRCTAAIPTVHAATFCSAFTDECRQM